VEAVAREGYREMIELMNNVGIGGRKECLRNEGEPTDINGSSTRVWRQYTLPTISQKHPFLLFYPTKKE